MASFVDHYEPRGTHWIATHAIDRIVALCGIVPYTVVALILRLLAARDIFLAGQAKIVGPTLPLAIGGFNYPVILPAHIRDETLSGLRDAVPERPGVVDADRQLSRLCRIHPADMPRHRLCHPHCRGRPARRDGRARTLFRARHVESRSTSIGGRSFWC